MKKRTISLALAALTAFSPAVPGFFRLPETILKTAAVSAAEDVVINAVDLRLGSAPVAGMRPDPSGYTVSAGRIAGVRWIDMTEKRELTASDLFAEGHVCSLSLYLDAPGGEAWATTSDGYPSVKVRCDVGGSVSDALSVMFNQNEDGSLTLMAVFTFTVAEPGSELPGTPSPDPEPTENGQGNGESGQPGGEAGVISGTESEPDSTTVKTAVVRGARIPAEGQRMQISGFDASPCTVRDAGWFNVTDNVPLETGETFVEGKEYCVSLFLLPPEGKSWAPDARVTMTLADGSTVIPSRSFIQMGGDGVVVLIGDFILKAVSADAVQPVTAPEQPETDPGAQAQNDGGTAQPIEGNPGEAQPVSGQPAAPGAEGKTEEAEIVDASGPSDLTVKPGDTAVFRASAGGDVRTMRWIAVNGNEIIPLSDGAFGYGSELEGTGSGTLTVKKVAREMNGVRFACVMIGADGSTVSSRYALLTVQAEEQTQTPAPFYDVNTGDWYYQSVSRAVSLGLLNGRGNGLYEPDGTVTFAEAVKLAAVIRERYETGAVTLENGDPWYATYADYADARGILTDNSVWGAISKQTVLARANEPVTRSEFAWIFSRALPAGALVVMNDIPDGSIPDLYPDGGEINISAERQNAIYALYRAGILNGSDSIGTFRPWDNIRRSEVAAIAVRMCVPGERVGAPSDLVIPDGQ